MSAAPTRGSASVAADLLYTDVEDQLRSSVRDLLAKRAPAAGVIARTESEEPYDPALWRALAVDIGVAGLAVPEELGGHGATWREVAVVAEELGASCAATPFLGHTMATVAARVARATDLLPGLVSGDVTAALAIPASGRAEDGLQAQSGTISGHLMNVVDALSADILLVPTSTGLYQVDASAVTRTPVSSMDMTRPLADLTFEAVSAIELAASSEDALRAALLIGGALLASEQLGIAEHCLAISVDYLKTRYQFGRQIGSYQALKHRAADLWAAVAQARAVARYAAVCVADHDPDAPIAVALAQAYCSPLAVRAAEECVQFHGGIGFTWEHPAHLYLKRAKADAALLGSASQHRATLGTLVGLPAE